VVPAPHDPDSFIKERGGEAFGQLIAKAEGFFDYYLARLCRLHDPATDKGRMSVLQGIGAAVLKTANAVLIDSVAQKTALRLGVTPDAVRAEFRKLSAAQRPAPPPPDEDIAPAQAEERPGAQETWLLRLMLLDEECLRWLATNLDLDWIQHPRVRQLITLCLDALAEERWRGVAAFLSECDDDLRQLVTEVSTDERGIPNAGQQLADLTLRLRNQYLDRRVIALIQQAGRPETGDAERLELLRQQQQLQQLKGQPLGGAIKSQPGTT
jgi:DNA primase